MAANCYLAMTAAEFRGSLPQKAAWMACHFSPYGSGLSNLPSGLPPGSLLILNDRIPFRGHDPERIGEELARCVQELSCCGLLMDFQVPDIPEIQALAEHLSEALPCPAAVSEPYAGNLNCPVFLSPCPHHTHPEEHFSPWQGRELWLDLARDAQTVTLTREGAKMVPFPLGEVPEHGRRDNRLHCHYHVNTGPDFARFTLWRTREDLEELAAEAEMLGIKTFVGLFQEFR